MVCFECQRCNETVKKPKLARHLETCGSSYVSCIDCSKVFAWNEWEGHTSCVSEAQKYQGSLYQAKESSNKGQVKQDAWVENVQRRIEDPSAAMAQQTRGLLQRLMGFTNIPRKQKPFSNFVKNSLKIWDDKKIEEMWEVVAAANPGPGAKAKPAEPAQADGQSQGKSQPRWSGWKRALDEELTSQGGELPWKRLRDLLVQRYQATGTANGASEEDLGYQALACIPEGYCSHEDEVVRLPATSK